MVAKVQTGSEMKYCPCPATEREGYKQPLSLFIRGSLYLFGPWLVKHCPNIVFNKMSHTCEILFSEFSLLMGVTEWGGRYIWNLVHVHLSLTHIVDTSAGGVLRQKPYSPQLWKIRMQPVNPPLHSQCPGTSQWMGDRLPAPHHLFITSHWALGSQTMVESNSNRICKVALGEEKNNCCYHFSLLKPSKPAGK